MVARAEMLAAQIFTARQMIDDGTVADLRVAIILLDSAMETLMVRRISYELQAHRYGESHWWNETAPVPIDLTDPGQLKRVQTETGTVLINWSFTSSQRSRLDRQFRTKLEFLVWLGILDPHVLPIAHRLHEYRNELYHRDEIRLGSLLVTAHLSLSIVAEMLRSLRPSFIGFGPDSEQSMERIYERMGRAYERHDGLAHPDYGFDLQDIMADELVRGLDEQLGESPVALADYVTDRIRRIASLIRFVGDYVFKGESFDNLDVIRLAYSTYPVPLYELAFVGTSISIEELRRERTSVTRAMLAEWDSFPTRIAEAASPYDALNVFAEFELSYEPFEEKISDLASEVDGALDMLRDR
ncbi:hypothetical protein [Agromyces cerinus]|uniref:Uncharacterized protein n=1 Tax=Agromyces cerinus subsp. cerinus TaxID=232089 RepID=A0A1N6DS91_9MICO|nr:hypothetical protein [Agromyces cerinus]SIN73668.1 hypothetical protein SAMN05443544_0675 [Agromyces cerinus subsp. cerinus]